MKFCLDLLCSMPQNAFILKPELGQAIAAQAKPLYRAQARLHEALWLLQAKTDAVKGEADAYAHFQRVLAAAQKEKENNERLLARIEELFEAHEEDREIDPEKGEFNEEAVLSQWKQVYGSGSARLEPGFFSACPADVQTEFDPDSLPEPSDALLWPARGRLSAGTWAYPGGGVHLGADLALPMHTPLKAPASGIVLYADAPVQESIGYPGNWSGYPAGAGNSVLMLCQAADRVYAISFFHLSGSIRVAAGATVEQNDIIALSGSSGNSTGPHVHIELIELAQSMEQAAAWFARTRDFSFGCGWQNPQALSPYGRRVRPELVFR